MIEFTFYAFQRVGARLGETDLTKEKDCDDCDPAVDYEIEKTIKHENYSKAEGNDIALIRLKEKVTITSFVKTICLPLMKQNHVDELEMKKFTVMGFGKTETKKRSEELLKTVVDFMPVENCRLFYKKTAIKNFHDGFLCAGGGKNDSCKGKFYEHISQDFIDLLRDFH